MILTKQQKRRWEAAWALFTIIKDAASKPGAMLIVDDSLMPMSSIFITESELGFKYDNCTYQWFEANPDCNHGLYDSVTKFAAEVRSRIKVVQQIKY